MAGRCGLPGLGADCPVCAGKQVLPGENDLASTFPALAAQWHPTQNGPLAPSQVSPYSNRKVWWRCELGHNYTAAVAARAAGGSGCPYCAGRKVLAGFNDLSTRAPALAAQWHPTLNGALTPEQVTTGSHKKSGGSARRATSGEPSSIPAPDQGAAAAPSAPENPARLLTGRPRWNNTTKGGHDEKEIFAGVLSLVMLLSLLPVTAFATGESNTTLPAADSNGVITLTSDVTLSDNVTGIIKVDTGSTVVLNLNGKSITSTSGCAIINKGNLTIKGTGTVSTSAAAVLPSPTFRTLPVR